MLVSMECKKQKKNSASLPRAMTKALGKEGSFAEGPSNSPRQRFFWKNILTISLPRAREQALGKGLKKFKKTISLLRAGPRQRIFKKS